MRHILSFSTGAACMSGLALSLLLLAPSPAGAGGKRPGQKFAAIDRHALATPKSAERSIPSLAAYLTRPARTELEKARAIYRWVTHNIAYDADAFFSRRFRNQRATPDSVLNTRKGVCDGYSRIYEGLARAAGLEVVRVTGYAKGYGYELGDRIPEGSNHAWNAVKVEGRWILLDSTWGAGSVSKEARAFVREYKEHYFQTDPAQMIYAHLPDDPRWQLLERKVSREKFAGLPKLRPLFFENNLELQSHKDGEIATGNQVEVRVKAPRNAEIIARVSQLVNHDERALEDTLSYARRDGGRYFIHARFPGPGRYILRLLVKLPNSGNAYGGADAYGGAMDYLVRASKGTEERFPLYLAPFFANRLKLDSHREGIIRTDTAAEVSLNVPPDVELTAGVYRKEQALDNSLSYLHRDGGRYRIHALFPRPGAYALRTATKPSRR